MGEGYSGGDVDQVGRGGRDLHAAAKAVAATEQGVVTAFARAYADVGDARVDGAMEGVLTASRRFLVDLAQALEAAGTVAIAAAGDLATATGGGTSA